MREVELVDQEHGGEDRLKAQSEAEGTMTASSTLTAVLNFSVPITVGVVWV